MGNDIFEGIYIPDSEEEITECIDEVAPKETTDISTAEEKNDSEIIVDTSCNSEEEPCEQRNSEDGSSEKNACEIDIERRFSEFGGKIDNVISSADNIKKDISDTSDAIKTISGEVREIHKLCQNEFAGRLRVMQTELDKYHKIDQRRVYDEILSDVARVYNNYEDIGDGIDDPKLKKSIKYLMMDLTEILENYGVEILKSNPGDKRNPYHSKVVERINTNDKNKHDTIAKSYNTGFYIDNRTLIKEMIDVYVYSDDTDEYPTSETNKSEGSTVPEENIINAENSAE